MDTTRIPIVIGVAAHLNPCRDDLPALEAQVVEILTKLSTAYPATSFIVLSSLAEGGDRLVARVALDLGMELVVPLPMPAEEFQKDFPAPESKKEFGTLLNQASSSFAVPYRAGVASGNIAEPDNRNEQYRKCGIYILRRCHILLALWDGDKTEKPGGTSQMVHYKLTGFPLADMPEWAVLNPPDAGTVYQIVTPREGKPRPTDALQRHDYHVDPRFADEKEEDGETAEKKAEKIFTSLLKRTDLFNRDVHAFELRLESKFKKSRAALDPAGKIGPLDDNLRILLDRYAAADVLANLYQGRRHLFLGLLCFLIVPVTLCLANYHAVDRSHPGQMFACIAGFWVIVIAAAILYIIAKVCAFEAKHLDYRALAEGLKILFFWRLAGISDDVAAQYMRKQRSDLDWIRLAVRASDLYLITGPEETSAWIKTQWMEYQRNYFDRRVAHNEARDLLFKWLSGAMLAVGLIWAFGMLVAHVVIWVEQIAPSESLGRSLHLISLGVVAALATSGALAAYAEKLAFAQQAKQYRQMHRLFDLAIRESDLFLKEGRPDHVRSIIRHLGHQALQENGDWVLLYRERPMEARFG